MPGAGGLQTIVPQWRAAQIASPAYPDQIVTFCRSHLERPATPRPLPCWQPALLLHYLRHEFENNGVCFWPLPLVS